VQGFDQTDRHVVVCAKQGSRPVLGLEHLRGGGEPSADRRPAQTDQVVVHRYAVALVSEAEAGLTFMRHGQPGKATDHLTGLDDHGRRWAASATSFWWVASRLASDLEGG
jgi:hypothetical protein